MKKNIKCPLCEEKRFSNVRSFHMHCHDKGGEHMLPGVEPITMTAEQLAQDGENEVTEMWRAHHAEQAEKRANNRANSLNLLQRAGVPFVSKNNGAHLIVDGRVDFWPGTSLWHCRITPTKGRGIRRLFDYLGMPFPAQAGGTMSKPAAVDAAAGL